MSSSNALREAQKRERAQEQIDANLSTPVELVEVNGKETALTRLYPMDSYSTKFMTSQDQVVLAVDKVDAPEVKTGMMPQVSNTEGFLCSDAEIFDYSAHLSLNDGDTDAFKSLRLKMEAYPWRKYVFEETPEGLGIRKEDFVLAYMSRVGEEGIGFMFDMYDNGTISGDPDVPSATASIELTKEYVDNAPQVKWEYVITMHSAENKKPKDATIKSEYLKLQSFMRAIIVTLGILPSNV